MIGKLLEAFFRHKLLVLMPPILIPLIVGPIALFMTRPYYVTYAGIWIDRSPYLSSNDGSSNYLTPAQNLNRRLGELLTTRSFLVDIANRTSLAPLVGSTKGEAQIQEVIGRGLSMFPNANQLLVVRFRADTPELAFQVVKALTEAYKEKTADDQVAQASLATSFYEARLQEAQQGLDKSNEAIRRYVAANPRLTTIDPSRGASATTAARAGLPTAAVDPRLAELLRQQDLDQAEVERVRGLLEKARLETQAGLEGQDLGFQVIDPPRLSTEPIKERRKLLIYPIAGLLIGLGLSATLLVLLIVIDHSVRSDAELQDLARVVGVVPQLELARFSKQRGPDTARRTIAFVAGAALPPALEAGS